MNLIHKFANDGRLVVFAGAGISVAAPTCLPSWWDIHKAVAEVLAKRVSDLIDADRSTQLAANIVARQHNEKFPPEYQAELIAGRLREDYFPVLQCLDSDQPNATHLTLAALARSGKLKAIITTNFDRAIETAFRQLDVTLVKHSRPEHFAELAADLGRFGQSGTPCQFLKIHGSVEDPTTLVDTLAQRKRGLAPSVSLCLRHLLRFGHWLFVGYSGADLEAEKNYLHLRGDSAEACGFTWLVQRTKQPLAPVQQLKTLYGQRAVICFDDLPGFAVRLCEELCSAVGVKFPGFSETQEEEFRSEARHRVRIHVQQWATNQRLDQCALVIADLLEATNQPKDALELVQRLHDATSEEERKSKHFAVVLNTLANMHSERGDYDVALAFLDKTLEYFDEQASPNQFGGALTNSALIFQRKGRPDEALKRLKRALILFDRCQSFSGRAVALHNMALAESSLGHHAEAEGLLHEEIEQLRLIGDEPGRGQALNDLGELLMRTKKPDEAVAHLNEARDIRVRLGNERGRAYSLGNLALVHCGKRDFAEARKIYEEILEIFELFDDKASIAQTLSNLASVALEEGHSDNAAVLVEKALALFGPVEAQGGNLAERLPLLQKLGVIRFKQGRMAEGIRCFENARTLHQAIDVPILRRTCLMELGIAYRDQRHLPEAERCFREARAISERLPRDSEHALVLDRLAALLNQRGLAAQEQRQFEQALPLFQESADHWRKADSRHNLGMTLTNIGYSRSQTGALKLAIIAYAEAVGCFDKSSDRPHVINLLCSMGLIEAACGHLDNALQNYAEAWQRCAERNQRDRICQEIETLAAQYAAKSLPLPAITLYEELLRLNEQLENPLAVATAKFNIGALLLRIGKAPDALPLLQQAVPTFEHNQHPFLEHARKLLAECQVREF